MKKILLLFMLLFLTACTSQAQEIADLEAEIYNLSQEIERLNIIILESERAQVANDVQESNASSDDNDEIIYSFVNNLDSTRNFLGIYDLGFARSDIEIHGGFLTARTEFHGNGVELVFRHWMSGDERRWELIEYMIGPISGPGKIDAGRSMGRWWQSVLFDENFTIRIYRYTDIDEYVYAEVEISYYDWQEQVKYYMQAHNSIQVYDLWYEGNRLVVDLKPAGVMFFNWGSHGGYTRTRSLIESLATMPNVRELEILVGGQRGYIGDHFSFGVVRLGEYIE